MIRCFSEREMRDEVAHRRRRAFSFHGFGFGAGARCGGAPAGFDPGSLAPTGWWRASFASSPWAGVASSGSSGGRDLTEATNPPTVGAALNSLNPADFDGVNDKLVSAVNWATYLPSAGASGVVLFNSDSAVADGTTSYLNPGLVTEATQGYGAAFADNGFQYGGYTGSWVRSTVSCSAGAWHLGRFKHDATGFYAGADSGAWGAPGGVAAPAYGLAPPGVLRLGVNYNASKWFDGRIAEVILYDSVLSDANFDNIRDYINSRYALSL